MEVDVSSITFSVFMGRHELSVNTGVRDTTKTQKLGPLTAHRWFMRVHRKIAAIATAANHGLLLATYRVASPPPEKEHCDSLHTHHYKYNMLNGLQ